MIKKKIFYLLIFINFTATLNGMNSSAKSCNELKEFLQQLDPQKQVIVFVNNESIEKSRLGSSMQNVISKASDLFGKKLIITGAATLGLILFAKKMGWILNKDIEEFGLRIKKKNDSSIRSLKDAVKADLLKAFSECNKSISSTKNNGIVFRSNMSHFSEEMHEGYGYLKGLINDNLLMTESCVQNAHNTVTLQNDDTDMLIRQTKKQQEISSNLSRWFDDLVTANAKADDLLESLGNNEKTLDDVSSINADTIQLLESEQFNASGKRLRAH